jgi:hypothetical protein
MFCGCGTRYLPPEDLPLAPGGPRALQVLSGITAETPASGRLRHPEQIPSVIAPAAVIVPDPPRVASGVSTASGDFPEGPTRDQSARSVSRRGGDGPHYSRSVSSRSTSSEQKGPPLSQTEALLERSQLVMLHVPTRRERFGTERDSLIAALAHDSGKTPQYVEDTLTQRFAVARLSWEDATAPAMVAEFACAMKGRILVMSDSRDVAIFFGRDGAWTEIPLDELDVDRLVLAADKDKTSITLLVMREAGAPHFELAQADDRALAPPATVDADNLLAVPGHGARIEELLDGARLYPRRARPSQHEPLRTGLHSLIDSLARADGCSSAQMLLKLGAKLRSQGRHLSDATAAEIIAAYALRARATVLLLSDADVNAFQFKPGGTPTAHTLKGLNMEAAAAGVARKAVVVLVERGTPDGRCFQYARPPGATHREPEAARRGETYFDEIEVELGVESPEDAQRAAHAEEGGADAPVTVDDVLFELHMVSRRRPTKFTWVEVLASALNRPADDMSRELDALRLAGPEQLRSIAAANDLVVVYMHEKDQDAYVALPDGSVVDVPREDLPGVLRRSEKQFFIVVRRADELKGHYELAEPRGPYVPHPGREPSARTRARSAASLSVSVDPAAKP